MKPQEIAITRQAVLPGPAHEVFAVIAVEDILPKVLTGYGPLPGVVSTSEHTGPWNRPGSARVIHLADGSTVREQITHYDSPRHFAYRVWAFGHPILRRMASGARGEWIFQPDTAGTSAGTHVTWTYTFISSSRVLAPALYLFVRLFWRGYMDVCLRNAQRLMNVAAVSA